jgi:hypothetical protein
MAKKARGASATAASLPPSPVSTAGRKHTIVVAGLGGEKKVASLARLVGAMRQNHEIHRQAGRQRKKGRTLKNLNAMGKRSVCHAPHLLQAKAAGRIRGA